MQVQVFPSVATTLEQTIAQTKSEIQKEYGSQMEGASNGQSS